MLQWQLICNGLTVESEPDALSSPCVRFMESSTCSLPLPNMVLTFCDISAKCHETDSDEQANGMSCRKRYACSCTQMKVHIWYVVLGHWYVTPKNVGDRVVMLARLESRENLANKVTLFDARWFPRPCVNDGKRHKRKKNAILRNYDRNVHSR